jgi:hypothetical protein
MIQIEWGNPYSMIPEFAAFVARLPGASKEPERFNPRDAAG